VDTEKVKRRRLFDNVGNFNAAFADRFANAFGHGVSQTKRHQAASSLLDHFAKAFISQRPT
jgi:hypothetical protein